MNVELAGFKPERSHKTDGGSLSKEKSMRQRYACLNAIDGIRSIKPSRGFLDRSKLVIKSCPKPSNSGNIKDLYGIFACNLYHETNSISPFNNHQ